MEKSLIWAEMHDNQPVLLRWLTGSNNSGPAGGWTDTWEWKVGIGKARAYPSGWHAVRVYLGTKLITWGNYSNTVTCEIVDDEKLYYIDLRWSSRERLQAIQVVSCHDVMNRLMKLTINGQIEKTKREVQDWKALKEGDPARAFKIKELVV